MSLLKLFSEKISENGGGLFVERVVTSAVYCLRPGNSIRGYRPTIFHRKDQLECGGSL
jgi:hypothetical protein